MSIVDVVGEQVVLKRAGSELKGLSPFSNEKTPSFYVNPDRQTYYCFSTNKGGDVIDFLMETKGISFGEAVDLLADRAGVPLDRRPKSAAQIQKEKAEAEARSVFLKLNKFAAHFFQKQLDGPHGALAREYVKTRGLAPATVEAFAIGFAPDSWTMLRDYLMSVQAPLVRAYELGLLRSRNGEAPKEDGSNLFDAFRNRLMFPIRDSSGEVIAFGGRDLSGAPDTPKYINSPESPVYAKSRTLYNLDRARKHVRQLDQVVLVEGYMDCIALDQAGFPFAVANCGTALAADHVKILKGLASRIICLYDADRAGQAATERNMELFLEAGGFPLLGARVPDGKDPDEFLRTHGEAGKAEMAKILEGAPAVLDQWIEKKLATTPATTQARADSLDAIARKLGRLEQDLWVDARLPAVARGLAQELELVVRAVRRYRKGYGAGFGANHARLNSQGKQGFSTPSAVQKTGKITAAGAMKEVGFEPQLLGDVLRYTDWLPALRKIHAGDANAILPLVGDAEVRAALEVLLVPLAAGESDAERIQALHERVRLVPRLKNLVAEAVTRPMGGQSPDGRFDAALERLRRGDLERRRDELKGRIVAAEQAGQPTDGAWERELQDVIRRLKGRI
ncbi:MAG: DNA primase [Bdellovibrionales bacterium]|nr:DNA primase [Bdellovibrionales bacterium]